MSLLGRFTKRQNLDSAIKKTQQARNSEEALADGLFKSAYQEYAEVLQNDSLRADTLYHWGFALLHQAKTKTDVKAAALLQDAISKFAFCRLLNPDYLGAAIDGGVAYMNLARLNQAKIDDPLYVGAKQQFDTANRIQKASASYNLACLHALKNDLTACQKALEEARNHGMVPSAEEIRSDPDLANAHQQAWFGEFLETLTPKAEPETPSSQARGPDDASPASVNSEN